MRRDESDEEAEKIYDRVKEYEPSINLVLSSTKEFNKKMIYKDIM